MAQTCSILPGAIDRERLAAVVADRNRPTFFSVLTRRTSRRGDFRSFVDLEAAIKRYVAKHNANPRPFTWTKPPTPSSPKSNVTLLDLNESVH